MNQIGKTNAVIFSGGNPLSAYGLEEGSKLHLMIDANAKYIPQTPAEPSVRSKVTRDTYTGPGLQDALFKALRKYFASDKDTLRVVNKFKRVTCPFSRFEC